LVFPADGQAQIRRYAKKAGEVRDISNGGHDQP